MVPNEDVVTIDWNMRKFLASYVGHIWCNVGPKLGISIKIPMENGSTFTEPTHLMAFDFWDTPKLFIPKSFWWLYRLIFLTVIFFGGRWFRQKQLQGWTFAGGSPLLQIVCRFVWGRLFVEKNLRMLMDMFLILFCLLQEETLQNLQICFFWHSSSHRFFQFVRQHPMSFGWNVHFVSRFFGRWWNFGT